jgi:hypothetical protein
MPRGILSRRSDTEQISWGKFSRFPCTVAGSTLRILDHEHAAQRQVADIDGVFREL